jgi:hypothetical protein
MLHLSRVGLCLLALTATLLSACATADKPPVAISPAKVATAQGATWNSVPTQLVSAGGVDFVYRELGQKNAGTPVILLTHLAAVLDNWDPRVVDGIAAKHHVVAFEQLRIDSGNRHPLRKATLSEGLARL